MSRHLDGFLICINQLMIACLVADCYNPPHAEDCEMTEGIYASYGEAETVRVLSISAKDERRCIQWINGEKQLKNTNDAQMNIVSPESRDIEMTKLADKHSRSFQVRESGSSFELKFIKGKTSGVTGGAVVEFEKRQYMLKNIFDRDAHPDDHFYDPNCKSEMRSFFTRHTLKEVNDSVLQEFTALRLANVVSPGIAPEVILGEIEDTVNGEKVKRYCLLTEMAGQEKGETFCTLDSLQVDNQNDKPFGVNKEQWKSAFAIGVGLLNDKDVNKKDNIGVVNQGETSKLSLFDLGHPSPDEFKLDPKTLLPKSKSRLADFVLWLINLFVPANSISGTFYFDKDIQNILSSEDRFEALNDLMGKKDAILKMLDVYMVNYRQILIKSRSML